LCTHQRQLRAMPWNCLWQFRMYIIASSNYVHTTHRSQFWDKIAWFATKRSA
jgi:hypothetical protein